ncbi:MAG: hypothetical protein AAGF91_00700 [Actinomycetota bacterium]
MTDLHTPSDRADTAGSDPAAPDAADHRTFRAATLDEAVAAARSELGPEVELVEAHRVRRGGLGGFFATDLGVEIVAAPSRRRPSATRPASAPSAPASAAGASAASLAGTPPPPPTRAEREEPRIATGLDRLIERVEAAETGGGDTTSRDALAGAIADAIAGSHPFDEQMRNEQMRNEPGVSEPTPASRPTRPAPSTTPIADQLAATIADAVVIPPLVDPLTTLDDELAQATTPSPRSTIEELDDELARHTAPVAEMPITDASIIDDGFAAPTGAPIDTPAAGSAANDDVDGFQAFDPDSVRDADIIDDLTHDLLDDDVEIIDSTDAQDDDTEIIGPDEGEWAPGEAALRQRKKELDRTLGALEEIDDLLRDVGVNVPARGESIGTSLVRAEPAPVEEIARVATSQLVEGIAALDSRCSSEIRRVSVSVTGTDGTTVCMSTELGDRRG